jgi:hypothetical protein
MKKLQLIAVAVASFCATSTHALTVGLGDEGDGGYAGYSGGGVVFPTVTITGRKEVSFGTSGGFNVWAGGFAPLARPPGGDPGDPGTGVPPRGAPGSPAEWDARKKQCLNDCSVSFQVNSNLCAQAMSDLRYEVSTRPYWSAIGAAGFGAIITKSWQGALVGAPLGWMYQQQVNADIVATASAQCAGAAALEYNWCIQAKCRAMLGLPFLLLVGRRRRKEDEDEDQSS